MELDELLATRDTSVAQVSSGLHSQQLIVATQPGPSSNPCELLGTQGNRGCNSSSVYDLGLYRHSSKREWSSYKA